tara:strand:- start:120 stop:281 length:162 start_codon:yes stop_codon:yes gene_type:complete
VWQKQRFDLSANKRLIAANATPFNASVGIKFQERKLSQKAKNGANCAAFCPFM